MIKIEKIALVDIETTGFLNKGGLIVEVGIVELNLENGEIKVLYDELVKENNFNEKHKDSWIFKNSDLKYEDVLNAKLLDKEKIQNILNKYKVTAYNKSFDFDFLRSRGLIIKKELICPMKLMTNVCKIPGYYGNYKWPSVQESWDYLFPNSDYIEKHRGADDAKHEAMIVYELYKKGLL